MDGHKEIDERVGKMYYDSIMQTARVNMGRVTSIESGVTIKNND